MQEYFNQDEVSTQLKDFFQKEKASINDFGRRVNQTFEAFVFASVIKWYKENGWTVVIVNPILNGRPVFVLKFNTRGAPPKYSYAFCNKDANFCQIRHGLRVHTKSYKTTNVKSANIVCDISVINDIDLDYYRTDTALPNEELIAFGEVKHMSGYAELVANFVGLAHELKPDSLKFIRKKNWIKPDNISCFLYVSGILYTTAKGLEETIIKRRYDLDIFSFDNPMNQ